MEKKVTQKPAHVVILQLLEDAISREVDLKRGDLAGLGALFITIDAWIKALMQCDVPQEHRDRVREKLDNMLGNAGSPHVKTAFGEIRDTFATSTWP